MVRSLERRVSRLEESAGGGSKCPGGGWGGDDFGPDDTYEVEWVDPGGPDDREEFCETCGRQLVYIVRWEDKD
jgi:hypothetical protein